MAGYCHGPNAPYGCGHHAEHVEAAKKGWVTRRRHQRGATFEGSEDQRLASLFVGGKVTHAHLHDEHPHTVVFKEGGKWYELPRRQFQSFIRGGRQIEREQQKRKAQQERQQQRENARALRYQIAQEKAVSGYTKQQRAEVVKFLHSQTGGGIRPDQAKGRYKGNHDEWLSLPSQLRSTKSHYTLDQAAELVADRFPELRIEDSNDLIRFFEKNEYQRRQSSSRRRTLQEELAGYVAPRKRKAS